jgi:prevent-host-death family protein
LAEAGVYSIRVSFSRAMRSGCDKSASHPPLCHTGEGRYPRRGWVPAFAGTTNSSNQILVQLMPEIVDVAKAADKLDDLVNRALAGEDVVIARNGTPLVRLVPVAEKREPRVPGRSKGRIWIAPDFNEMSEEELKDWEGP